MPTYITLFRWTQLGIENVKESPRRLDAARQLFQQMGGEVKAFYVVMGQYDAVLISEAPDDETMAKISLAATSHGAIRSETMRAFTEEEYRKVITGLP
ncbi:MAG: GYD domain-containing protein [Acidobacteriota bacterium]|nr:GYD domain-containing protein [Acidobacteriota bacterium]